MHFAIRYQSRYRYDGDVVDNINALRIRPATGSRQRLDDFTLRLTPEVRQHRHEDYFGTEVIEFEVTRPHRELAIDAHAHVATEPQPEPPSGKWAELAADGYCEAGAEFLMQTDDAADHPLLAELRAEIAASATPLDALRRASEVIPDRIDYRKGATYVDSTLTHMLDVGAGVCQDFVHLGLNLLRAQGIAARYVSGYLYTRGEGTVSAVDGAASVAVASVEVASVEVAPLALASVEVDTHAWIEALLPSGADEPRWVGVDPTNGGLTGERHVKIGHGRHYGDVPPIKGIYRGSATSTLDASVTMTRTEPIR
ncbi:MAG: transglutaminase family protein [Acidobacteriota bacterium]|nr:transglutaminase family protein [Acidobacteriota bacterium]